MYKLFIIGFLFLFSACEDDDRLFSPPKSFVAELNNEINYYRLTSGHPLIDYSSFIEDEAYGHALYLADIDSVNYVNQDERFMRIQSELDADVCFEYIDASNMDADMLMDKWTGDVDINNILLNYRYFGLASVKSDKKNFRVVIFVL